MNTVAERASKAQSPRHYGPGWRGLVLLLFLLYPALPNPAVAGLNCDDRADCEIGLDRFPAEATAPWYTQTSANTEGLKNLRALESDRRLLTMKLSDNALYPVEFEICGPQPLVDIFIEELEYHSKDLKKFDIYEIIAIIKEYFPCN